VSDEARSERRRLKATLLVAVVLPAAALAYGAALSVRSDEVVLGRLREERLSLAARAVVAEVEAEARALARAALDPAIVDVDEAPGREAYLEAVEARLEAARARHAVVREYALLEPRGRALLPVSRGPSVPVVQDEVPLKDAVLRFERRQALERRLEGARRLEARHAQGDPAGGEGLAPAREAYLEAAEDRDHPDIAARARLDLARLLAREGDVDAAVDALDVLARMGPEVATDAGLPIAPAARLRAGELRLEGGRAEDGAARLLDLADDVLSGRAPLAPEDARFFADRALAAVRDALPRLTAPAFAEALARQERASERRRARAAWARDLATRLLPDLAPLLGSLAEGEARLVSIGGAAPRLLALARVSPAGQTGSGSPVGATLVLAAELDLDALRLEAAPLLRRLAKERDARLSITDRRGRPIASSDEAPPSGAGAPASPDAALEAPAGLAATASFEEVLPFWIARAAASESDPEAHAARLRLLLQGGLLGLMVAVLGAGAWLTVRAVERSLALARMKSDFVAHVSHELRTPLTSIRMFAEMLRTGRAKTPEKTRDYLERIEAESARLQRLIDDLLDFARLEAGRKEYAMETAPAGEVAAAAVAAMRAQLEGAGFEVALDVAPALPPVRLDRASLQAALENLLMNAKKYAADRRRVAVRVVPSGAGVAIEVADQGIGIGEDELPRLFERFFRGKDAAELNVPGSGLGLALVKRVAEDHGGRVSVASKKGLGTTFRIELPAVS